MNDSPAPKGTALVTGAGHRLGATMARALAIAGYAVIVHYRSSEEDARRIIAEIKAGGGKAALVKADLTKRRERAALIARAQKPFGPLTVLVNNASLFMKDDIATLAEDYWDTHFAIHAEAPVFLARDFAAQLPKNTKGSVINIVDERVLHPAPAAFSYNLSKSVLWIATQTLAQQLAPRIRVNAIGPGPILPEASQSQQSYNARSREALLGRNASPDDVVGALLYLLSAPGITGQMISVDAGDHLRWHERRGPTPRKK